MKPGDADMHTAPAIADKASLRLVTVAISTLGAGIGRIVLPSPRQGLEYLVLHQAPAEASHEAVAALCRGRDDVTVVPLPGSGLSHSRNAGLLRAQSDLVLFSDDDVALVPEGVLALRDRFSDDPDLVLAAGWRVGRLPRGARATVLTRFNSGRICAPEFMVHKGRVQALGVQFDSEFGLGATYGLGEDYIFVCDLLRAGGKGQAFPVETGAHPHASTGDKWDDPDVMRARQAVIWRVFRGGALAVRLAYAVRHRRNLGSARAMWRFVWPERQK
ncbi:glycosyltransferase family 2 protein [Epibacterium sp. MM17-32]|uniref:glycosyltransferase family A protein n=1 Tax=Epibacterium sp. MM17-32 TaxID=2917734 RepID=UPI001EF47A26|nr:glycosyltransferase family A protein [Epibacterium sp. MM17-32]MCG7630326.1 glycosyltransferase family 2 protein [Epibacterium sp. MM17-32]